MAKIELGKLSAIAEAFHAEYPDYTLNFESVKSPIKGFIWFEVTLSGQWGMTTEIPESWVVEFDLPQLVMKIKQWIDRTD